MKSACKKGYESTTKKQKRMIVGKIFNKRRCSFLKDRQSFNRIPKVRHV
jgi:hypothetical protein